VSLDCAYVGGIWNPILGEGEVVYTLRIYSTCVLTILLYGSETWTLIQADWNKLDSFHVAYGANDASCTSDGTTSYLTMKSCIVPACSMSRTSFASEDWVSLGTSPDFDVMYQQTRSYESAPSRGMVSSLHRSGDVTVADHRPPGPTRSAATRG